MLLISRFTFFKIFIFINENRISFTVTTTTNNFDATRQSLSLTSFNLFPLSHALWGSLVQIWRLCSLLNAIIRVHLVLCWRRKLYLVRPLRRCYPVFKYFEGRSYKLITTWASRSLPAIYPYLDSTCFPRTLNVPIWSVLFIYPLFLLYEDRLTVWLLTI